MDDEFDEAATNAIKKAQDGNSTGTCRSGGAASVSCRLMYGGVDVLKERRY